MADDSVDKEFQDVPVKDKLNESKIRKFYSKRNQMNRENLDSFNPLNTKNENISFATLSKLGKDKLLDSELFEQENKIIKEMLHNSVNKSAFGSKDDRNLDPEKAKKPIEGDTPIIEAGKYYRDLVQDHITRIKNTENIKKNFLKVKRKPNFNSKKNIDLENELNASKFSDEKRNKSQEVVEMNSYYLSNHDASEGEDAPNDRQIPYLVVNLQNTLAKEETNYYKNLNSNINDTSRNRMYSNQDNTSAENVLKKHNSISLCIEDQKDISDAQPFTRLNYYFKPQREKLLRKSKQEVAKLRINKPLKDNSLGPGSYEFKSCFDKAVSKKNQEDFVFKNWVENLQKQNQYNLMNMGPGKYNPTSSINPIYKFKPSPFFLDKKSKDPMLDKVRLIKKIDRKSGPISGSYHYEKSLLNMSRLDHREDYFDYNEHSMDPKDHETEFLNQPNPGPGSYNVRSSFDNLKNKPRRELNKQTKKIFDMSRTRTTDLQTLTKQFRAKKKALARIAKSTDFKENNSAMSPERYSAILKPGPGTYDSKPSLAENLLNKKFSSLRYKIRSKQQTIKKEDVDNLIMRKSMSNNELPTPSKLTKTYNQINAMLNKFDTKKTETCLPFLSKIPNWDKYFSKKNILKMPKDKTIRSETQRKMTTMNMSDRYWLNDSKFDCYELQPDILDPVVAQAKQEKNLWIINNLNL